MTIMEYMPGDIVLFCDTGREHPKTYKFINDFEAFENIPVIRLSYPGGWEQFLIDKGYNYLPNRTARNCTKELKVRTARKYLLSIGVKECQNFIGFRADEKRRVDNYDQRYVKYYPVFSLYTKGIDNQKVNDYWSKKPYTLEIPHILGNCDCCFLKGKNAIIKILKVYPELADKWIADEDKFNARYIKDISFRQMKAIASNNLFKNIDLDNQQPAFNCSCTT